jgi:hypothetical protein
MSWQVRIRALVMVGSTGVIALLGGPAALDQLNAASTEPTRPVALWAGPTVTVTATDPGLVAVVPESQPGPATVVVPVPAPTDPPAQTATSLTLELVGTPSRRGARAEVSLRGTLSVTDGVLPAGARVTLWRKASGKWKPIVRNQVVSPEGVVDLHVAQSGRTSVYRLTFAASAPYEAATSASLTVRRR